MKAHNLSSSTPWLRSVTAQSRDRSSGTMPKPWYHKGLSFECTRCGNCCRNHGDYAFVYLTDPDVAAISAHLGLDRQVFLERYCCEHDGAVSLRTDSPACAFLQPDHRCAIYPVRPRQCATWPFWRENLKKARQGTHFPVGTILWARHALM